MLGTPCKQKMGVLEPLGWMVATPSIDSEGVWPVNRTDICWMVGDWNNAASGILLPKDWSIRANNCAAKRECPPTSKKLALVLIVEIPSTFSQIASTRCSVSFAGAA